MKRRGFTLIELLIVMAILVILATLLMVALMSAQTSAKVARTKAVIRSVNQILAERYGEFETRRVGKYTLLSSGSTASWNQASLSGVGRKRVNGLRELMRMELPDRKTDVLDDPVVLYKAGPVVSIPPLTVAYRSVVPATWTTTHQGAECLYLILRFTTHRDSNGLSAVPNDMIKDTDKDGVPEIVDAFGKPLLFLRWAPGFKSKMQPGPNSTSTTLPNNTDPIDPLGVYSTTVPNHYLFPLIMSAGPNQEYGINANFDSGSGEKYSTYSPPNNPYGPKDTGGDFLFGAINDAEKASDNIHNQGMSLGL